VTGVVVRRIRTGDAALLRDVRLRAPATDPESFGSTHARAAGARALHLSVAGRAEAAAALYRSAGFEPDGQRTDSRHTSGLVEIGLAKRLR